MSKEAVNKMIKSCIVSRKGGVPMGEIENDYKDLVGQAIPYISLGYRTLQDFIRSIDFVNVKTNYFGDPVLSVSDPKIAHIDSLVSKQKNSTKSNANSKQKRRNRWGKSRQCNNNKIVTESRRGIHNSRPNYDNKSANNYNRRDNFGKNTRMEYTQSKWYNDRSKDSWKLKRIETREIQRYNNFNTGRPSLQNSSNNSSTHNHDNSWSARTTSPISSVEDNIYNFNSNDEKRYAQDSRSWRFRVQPADNAIPTEFCLEPLVNGQQLIGDDFFLQLAIKNFKAEPRKPNGGAAIRCGLCVSGQTIDECRQRLEKTQYLSGKVTILLGAVDIFRGHSLERMVNDMKKLLDVCRDRFNLRDNSQITLCTIPPLANYSVRFNLRKLSVLYSFNNWIKLHNNFSPDDSYIHHYNVIDLFTRFTDCNHRTIYEYFQLDARMVSGCPYPHILWNSKGRFTAISMLDK